MALVLWRTMGNGTLSPTMIARVENVPLTALPAGSPQHPPFLLHLYLPAEDGVTLSCLPLKSWEFLRSHDNSEARKSFLRV